VARNPRIQAMFRMIGYGENLGSGFPTILSAWGDENWRKPDLRQNDSLHQVELRLWMISLLPPECTQYLQEHFGWVYSTLNREEQIILGTAYLENEVSNTRLQSIFELNSIAIGHILSTLVERQLLVAQRKGRWTSYHINEEYTIPERQLSIVDVPEEKITFTNETDKQIYDYIRANGFITTPQIIEITNITTRAGAVFAVNRLIARNLVRKVRKGKHFIYEMESN
nr:AAA family ATPase [Clostridia bacterium]